MLPGYAKTGYNWAVDIFPRTSWISIDATAEEQQTFHVHGIHVEQIVPQSLRHGF